MSENLESLSHDPRDLEQFRKYGHQLIDWIADYHSHPENFPVLSQRQPGDIQKQLPDEAPQQAESLDQILKDAEDIVVPGMTHWNHPGFMAYFSVSGSPTGLLGELMAAAFNVNAMLWKTSPAATELEQVVLDWLRKAFGFPETFFGAIHDTASTSTLIGLIAAREAVAEVDVRKKGLSDGPPLCVYISDQTHSSVEKAAIIVGVGQDYVRTIPSDDEFRMDINALEAAIKADVESGHRPFVVVPTIGTTSTTSADDVEAVADLAEKYNLWLHVDAAYAGPLAMLPEMRHHFTGCERADSYVTNAHKWLFTQIGCSILYCSKPDVLKRALSLVPEYLKTQEEDEVVNYMDYGVALGRRFNALKLWFVLRSFGVEGLQALWRKHLEMAQQLRRWVEAHPDFEMLAPTPFSVVCFRAKPSDWSGSENALDELNNQLMHAVNRAGKVFFSHTRLKGHLTLRMAIGHLYMETHHVQTAWEAVTKELQHLLKK